MPNIKDAVYLIDDDSIFAWGGLRTGWDFINDCAEYHAPAENSCWLLRGDGSNSVTLRRDCNRFEGGVLTLETKLFNLSGDGFTICLGTRESAFLTLKTKGEMLYVGDAEIGVFAYGMHQLRVEADLPSKSARIWIDAKCCGSFAFTGEGVYFNCLRYLYGKGAVGEAKLAFAKLYVNFLFNDYNLLEHTGDLPDGYQVRVTDGASVVSEIRPSRKNEYAYISKNAAGSKSAVTANFKPAEGVVALEIKYLQPECKGKFTLKLLGADVSVWDAGEQLMTGSTALRTHHANVWQTLRIAADTKKGIAAIHLNGKKTQEISCASAAVSGFTISYEADEDSIVMFSDMKAWVIPEEPEDYVPAPTVPKKKDDYIVGINICSLWREGSHFGWDTISPYADLETVLGFYDEGLPETSDWEIKFMLEHGIDYALYCWYSAEVREPIKSTHLHHAWLDGHFYAKYGDQMKFALLWEAVNCAHPTCLEDFKSNLVPYWLDYFFSDPRYMSIDNKAVMSCFGVSQVEHDLGGEQYVREGLQYLRNEVKKLGYDDLIVMGCHASPRELQRLGFDAFHAYHWGPDGYKLQTNIDSNNKRVAQNAAHVIPTISVGFKNIGWGGKRRPNLSVQDMYKGLVYCRDKLLPKYKSDNPNETWKSRMLHLSTWNEYGEGTYIMPSGLNGFGYLDAVRKALCVDAPHTDIVPTEAQKARICYLRPQTRYKLGNTKYDTRSLPETDTPAAVFEFKTEDDLKRVKFTNIDSIRIENGRLCGNNSSVLGYIDFCDLDIDMDGIAYGEVVQTNSNANTKAPTQAYISFSHQSDCGDCRIKGMAIPFLNTDFSPIPYRFDLDTNPWWHGKLRGIRLFATYSGTFEVERIVFYAAKPHISVYVGEKKLFLPDYPEVKNGEIFLPLDPGSGIIKALGFHHEWHRAEQRLTLYKGENLINIVVGRAYADVNGEALTLSRPAYLKDGIPTLTLSDMKLIFGGRFTQEGDKLFIH